MESQNTSVTHLQYYLIIIYKYKQSKIQECIPFCLAAGCLRLAGPLVAACLSSCCLGLAGARLCGATVRMQPAAPASWDWEDVAWEDLKL